MSANAKTKGYSTAAGYNSSTDSVQTAIATALHHKSVDALKAKTENRRRTVLGSSYTESLHEFQLTRGDLPVGKPQQVWGRDATARNKEYEAAFIAGKHPRMYRLKWLRCVDGPFLKAQSDRDARRNYYKARS